MDIRFQTKRPLSLASVNQRATRERGASAIQILVILVPVVFALMGFALDLGILYSVKGELKSAAESMALAATGQQIGRAHV